MNLEFENAPQDCKQAIGQIYTILDAGDYLDDLLALAPAFSLLPSRVTLLSAIWRLGLSGARYARLRATTQGVVAQITRNRIHTICDSQILLHQGNGDLVKHWTRIRSGF